jgi:hypothetical protein
MNLEDLVTPADAAAAIGAPNKRAVYRAIARAEAAGEDVTYTAFGRRLIRRDRLDVVKKYYFPYYSDAHQASVRKWGAAGGAASGVTKRLRKAAKEKGAG